MEFLSILSVLARRWMFAAAGAVAAIAVAVAVAPVSTRTAVADGKVLVDTSSSRAVDLLNKAEAIGTQTELLAGAILDDRQRTAIARAAGVSADQLGISVAYAAPPPLPSPLGRRVLELTDTSALPYTVSVSVESEVPIITIRATAADASAATRLTRATSSTLQSIAARSAPRGKRALVVEQLGGVRSGHVVSGRGGAPMMVAIALLVFVVWCCAVVIVPSLLRALWRGGTTTAAA